MKTSSNTTTRKIGIIGIGPRGGYAFEKFIRRNDFISINKKEPLLNFILLTRKITNAIYQNTLDQDLLHQVKNKKSVALKEWLLEKISQNL